MTYKELLDELTDMLTPTTADYKVEITCSLKHDGPVDADVQLIWDDRAEVLWITTKEES